MNSRDKILGRIKAIREEKNQIVTLSEPPVASGLKAPEGDLAEAFKNSIELVQGDCYLFNNQEDCLGQIQQYISENSNEKNVVLSPSLHDFPFKNLKSFNPTDIADVEVGISRCELLVAQMGTALVTSKEGRKIIGLSPIHIIIAERSQLRLTLDDGVKELAKKYGDDLPSQLTLITGPSRTADIEKTLILGAHGPKKLAVFIY